MSTKQVKSLIPSEQEQGRVYWMFYEWLEKNSGKESADALNAITGMTTIADIFQHIPEEKITRQQKGLITQTRRDLDKAAAWLETQGANHE